MTAQLCKCGAAFVPWIDGPAWLQCPECGRMEKARTGSRGGRVAADPEPPTNEPPVPAIAPYRPFPVEAIPDAIRAYAVSVAAGMDADPILVIAPALSAFAGAIGNAVRVVVRKGWDEPCCLWTGVLSLPGSLKTQTQGAATVPMHDAQRRADAEYAEKMRDYEADCSARDAAKKAKDEAIPPQPEEPIRRQWLVGDTTPEALAHVLKGNPRGVVSLHDELGSLFGGFGQYKKNGSAEPGAAFYKSAFNGSPFTENRKGDKGRGLYLRIGNRSRVNRPQDVVVCAFA